MSRETASKNSQPITNIAEETSIEERRDFLRKSALLLAGLGIDSLLKVEVNAHPQPTGAPIKLSNHPRPERVFRYNRMYDKLSAFRFPDEAAIELGLAMHADSSNNKLPASSTLPAGYTYLGQFITHNITFEKTAGLPVSQLSPEQIRQGRSPSLELDSVYGMGPLSESSKQLYENDGLRFKIGVTTPTYLGDAFFALSNDLPRDGSDPKNSRKALIADQRNDRHLVLAQTHLAFLKFHNAVVNRLSRRGLAGSALFEEARKKVIQHFQWIVLHDYLPRVIDRSVLNKVLANGPKDFKSDSEGGLYPPIEFTFAAYRFGHSQVRDKYEWNRIFQTQKMKTPEAGIHKMDAARLHHLFMLTGLNGNLQGAPTLPTNWVIDWKRFYDLSKYKRGAMPSTFNYAKKIGASLSLGLKSIPGFPIDINIEPNSLAVLDLKMGSMLGLPAGQDVAEEIGAKSLSADKIAKGPHSDILIKYGFHQRTPLWYYILKEAEIVQNGERLGEVGSRIVAETIVGLIRASEHSILKTPNWRPDLGQAPAQFEMADLLVFVNDLNPLDRRKPSPAFS